MNDLERDRELERAAYTLRYIMQHNQGAYLCDKNMHDKSMVCAKIINYTTAKRSLWVIKSDIKDHIINSIKEKFGDSFFKQNRVDFINYREFSDCQFDLKPYDFIIIDDCLKLRNWGSAVTQKFYKNINHIKFLLLSDKPIFLNPKNHIYSLVKMGPFKDFNPAQFKARYFSIESRKSGLGISLGDIQFGTELVSKIELISTYLPDFTKKSHEHSRFGPSGLKILTRCPGSYWLEDTSSLIFSGAAHLGKVLHRLGENLILDSKEAIPPWASDYLGGFVTWARAMKFDWVCGGVETRVSAPSIRDDLYGTVDFWAYRADDTLVVADFKSGQVDVNVTNNWQLLAYTLMIIESYKLKPKRVINVIWQRNKKKSVGVSLKKLELFGETLKKLSNHVDKAKECPKTMLWARCTNPFCKSYKIHKELNK